MTYVKLEDAVKVVEAERVAVDSKYEADLAYNLALSHAAEALRSLPTDDGWEDIATEPIGLIHAIMDAGPIGCCNISEQNASDILYQISEYMKAKKGE